MSRSRVLALTGRPCTVLALYTTGTGTESRGILAEFGPNFHLYAVLFWQNSTRNR